MADVEHTHSFAWLSGDRLCVYCFMTLDELVEETERKMLGLPPPSNIDDFKAMPGDAELGLEGSARRPSSKALRAFLLTNGRAPTDVELEDLMGKS